MFMDTLRLISDGLTDKSHGRYFLFYFSWPDHFDSIDLTRCLYFKDTIEILRHMFLIKVYLSLNFVL